MVGMDITVDELVKNFTFSLTDLLSPDGYVFVLINDTKVIVHPELVVRYGNETGIRAGN